MADPAGKAVRRESVDSQRRPPASWAEVPWRTIFAAVGVVVGAIALLTFLYLAFEMVMLVVIAAFFAVVLAPPVRMLERRLHMRHGMAAGVMMIASCGAFVGLLALFIMPVRTQLMDVLTDLPGSVRQAAQGRGPLGKLVTRLRIEELVDDNKASLTSAAESLQRSYPELVATGLQALLAMITVVVMAWLMLTQSAVLARTSRRLIPERHRQMVTDISRRAAGAVSGYMIGNLLISLCAGVAALTFLLIAGVPNPVVIALWVAFADLIPLVGAVLGAVVAVFAALLVSPAAGIAAIVFFLVYQQFENSVLQVQIMARTVNVNPLAVLLSVLLGVALFGFVGALLAIPLAGATSVLIKEIYRYRRALAEPPPSLSECGIVLVVPDPEAGDSKAADDAQS